MSLKEYDLLLARLDEIADRVERLSPHLQEVAFSSLVSALLQPDQTAQMDVPEEPETSAEEKPAYVEPDHFDEVSTMLSYYKRYGLEYVSDMEFATFVGYFHSLIAPPQRRSLAISASHYEQACDITGRKLPGSVGGTLNNALNLKSYLERRGTGLYSLSETGRHYIENILIKENS